MLNSAVSREEALKAAAPTLSNVTVVDETSMPRTGRERRRGRKRGGRGRRRGGHDAVSDDAAEEEAGSIREASGELMHALRAAYEHASTLELSYAAGAIVTLCLVVVYICCRCCRAQ